MPMEKVFLERSNDQRHFKVVKTYDSRTARDAFEQMSAGELEVLSASLDLEANFDAAEISASSEPEWVSEKGTSIERCSTTQASCSSHQINESALKTC
ncbi:MAG: hypothetical protein QOJ51_5103 [Acidobacteriaceae bacterium]|jgi:hypothetical protein|nr:hypothetical protein [Acidobacteriaceae bacterium]MEA2262278.1 hypothetical protein [Acidobacteriaceae bacterium]